MGYVYDYDHYSFYTSGVLVLASNVFARLLTRLSSMSAFEIFEIGIIWDEQITHSLVRIRVLNPPLTKLRVAPKMPECDHEAE